MPTPVSGGITWETELLTVSPLETCRSQLAFGQDSWAMWTYAFETEKHVCGNGC